MSQIIQFQVSPEQAKNDLFLKNRIKDQLNIESNDFQFIWRKRSIDARKSVIKINCSAKFHYICARLRNENNKHKNINKVNFFIKTPKSIYTS